MNPNHQPNYASDLEQLRQHTARGHRRPAPVHPRTKGIANLVAKVSPANRPALEAHIEYSRGQAQMSEHGIYSFARPVAHADALLGGKDFRHTTSQDWLQVVSAFRRIYGAQSLRIRVINLRKHVRYVFDVDDLEKAEGLDRKEGRAMEKALWVRRERPQVVGQVIAEGDLDALLDSIPKRDSLSPAFPIEVRDRAILAVLRASGHRGGEFVSLNLTGGGVVREESEKGPLYRLALAPDALDLKTGARTIYITDRRAVEALDKWLAVHPFRHEEPTSPNWWDGIPLFVNADAGICVRFTTTSLRKLVSKAVAWAGIGRNYRGKLTPHDFRHTCATEKARLGWNEFQLCAYFGWAPGSKTPAIYVHLKLDDQRALLLRNVPVAPHVMQAPQAVSVEALVGLLQQAQALIAAPTAVPSVA